MMRLYTRFAVTNQSEVRRRRFLPRVFARASDRFFRHFAHLQPRGVMTLMK
jgi:hypothetical protein